MPYRALNPDRLVSTLERLSARIDERFPERGIAAVCRELLELARKDAGRTEKLGGPNILLRSLITIILAVAACAVAFGIYSYRLPDVEREAFHAFQGIEALVNLSVLAGAAIWFLLNLEARIKRSRILADLHELRSIAHVIDMHQLTKDPMIIRGDDVKATPSSPDRNMTDFELSRYLDYCAEMLSLTGKLSAMYMRASRDPAITSAITEIEDLTTNLSRKIWQKIMILRQSQITISDRSGTSEDDGSTLKMTGQPTANANCSPLHPFAVDKPEKD
ncbi:MAG: hypothetical protein AAF216_03515 [Pseudomonadota bacterium]